MSMYGDRAYAAFFKGYNCCQSVAVAFADEMGMTEKQALQLSAGFGGGFGRMREVCGAFSGITLVLGALYGSDDPAQKTALYTEVQAWRRNIRPATAAAASSAGNCWACRRRRAAPLPVPARRNTTKNVPARSFAVWRQTYWRSISRPIPSQTGIHQKRGTENGNVYLHAP